MVKLEMLKTLSFIQILCLKQQSKYLRYFFNFKFETKFIQQYVFQFYISLKEDVKWKDEKDQVKYFAQN